MNGLGQFALLGGGRHPACVEVFSDWGSVFHVALGAAAGTLDPRWAVIIGLAFAGYQISQVAAGQSWERTGGEMIEFALGMAGMLVYEQSGGPMPW